MPEFVNADPIAIGLSGFRPASGYRVHIAFLSLPNPELTVARVIERVRQGGHDVPEAVVRRRFIAGLRNFLDLYQGVADTWQLFDNASTDGPRLIASSRQGQSRISWTRWHGLI